MSPRAADERGLNTAAVAGPHAVASDLLRRFQPFVPTAAPTEACNLAEGPLQLAIEVLAVCLERGIACLANWTHADTQRELDHITGLAELLLRFIFREGAIEPGRLAEILFRLAVKRHSVGRIGLATACRARPVPGVRPRQSLGTAQVLLGPAGLLLARLLGGGCGGARRAKQVTLRSLESAILHATRRKQALQVFHLGLKQERGNKGHLVAVAGYTC